MFCWAVVLLEHERQIILFCVIDARRGSKHACKPGGEERQGFRSEERRAQTRKSLAIFNGMDFNSGKLSYLAPG
jgi:hypothetical protein